MKLPPIIFAIAFLFLPLISEYVFGDSLPDGFFTLLRIIVTLTSLYLAWLCKVNGNKYFLWMFAFISVLFNPIIPIHFEAEAWHFWDIATGFLFIFFILRYYKINITNIFKRKEFKTALIILVILAVIGILPFIFKSLMLGALSRGELKRVKELIAWGADVNTEVSNGNTPLILAIKNNDSEYVKFLIKQGAHLDSIYNFKVTPLICSLDKDLKITELLVEAGADVNKNWQEVTPLSYAVKINNVAAVNLLLKKGAKANKSDCTGYIAYKILCELPLDEAIVNKQAMLISLLLEHSADVNLLNREGVSPIGQAIKAKSLNSIKTLLEKGVDLDKFAVEYEENLFRKDGILPLDLAVESGNLEIVKALVNNGANIYKGHPILSAIKSRNVELLEYLDNVGADKEAGDGKDSPLTLSIKMTDLEAMEYLLKNGVNVNGSVVGGDELLTAIEAKNLNAIKLLRKFGFDVNKIIYLPRGKNYLLEKAVDSLDTAIFAEVLDMYGSRFLNSDWKDLLYYAKKNGTAEIVKIMIKKQETIELYDFFSQYRR